MGVSLLLSRAVQSVAPSALGLALACSGTAVDLEPQPHRDAGTFPDLGGLPDAGPAVRDAGLDPEDSLFIVPQRLNFGVVQATCEARARTVTLYNVGPEPLFIDRIELARGPADTFRVVRYPAPLPDRPRQIEADGSVLFDLGFTPDAISSYGAYFEVEYRVGNQSYRAEIEVVGEGRLKERQFDDFELAPLPQIDELLVIDNTSSMADEQAALRSNLDRYFTFYQARGSDIQIGVITTDGSGDLRATEAGVRVLTSTSSLEDFRALTEVGTAGSEPARPLLSVEEALSEAKLSTVNRGFVRDGAYLSVIVVSDGPEESPGTDDSYLNAFFFIKGFRNTQLFYLSAITAPRAPESCEGTAQSNGRLEDLALRTGGLFQSICTDNWSRRLEDLAGPVGWRIPRFFLTNQPVISSIEVEVNGESLPEIDERGVTAWTYDFATNTINFSPWYTPEPGWRIRVSYLAGCP